MSLATVRERLGGLPLDAFIGHCNQRTTPLLDESRCRFMSVEEDCLLSCLDPS